MPVITCNYCNTKLKAPKRLTGKRVRCPKCKKIFCLPKSKKASPPVPAHPPLERLETVWHDGPRNHPYNVILCKYADSLEQYGESLQILYDNIRRGKVHKHTFQAEKIRLKKQVFPSLVDDVINADIQSFHLLDRVSLWHDVLEIMPHRSPIIDEGVVLNSYPRYDLANLFGLAYASATIENRPLARSLVGYRLNLLPAEISLTTILLDLRDDEEGYNDLLIRVSDIIEQNEYLHTNGSGQYREVFEMMFENFGFGFNWIAMHLDVEDLEEELWK
jgi:hypothetical protein